MKFQTKLAAVAGALALSATPALAAGIPENSGTSHVPENPGTSHIPATPGPHAPLPMQAAAYGTYCKAESKKHVDGVKGTPFSLCVTAMAKLANGVVNNPQTACKAESKEHVEGARGTPFSLCVSAGAKLIKDLEAA